MATAAPKRILVLHGYTQNASIFSKRMGAIRKACGKDVEFEFVDAPIILEPADIPTHFATAPSASDPQQSTLANLGAPEASPDAPDPALLPRAWWKTNATRTESRGLEESLLALRDVLHSAVERARPFSGVFGFSQGAAMAALLSAVLEHPERIPVFLPSLHPQFTFCVAVAGFRTAGPLADTLFEGGYSTPTLHVLGRTDIIVTAERAASLLETSHNKRIAEHDGGHFVPSKAPWRNFFKSYFEDPLGQMPVPGADGGSEPSSGAVTPVNAARPSAAL